METISQLGTPIEGRRPVTHMDRARAVLSDSAGAGLRRGAASRPFFMRQEPDTPLALVPPEAGAVLERGLDQSSLSVLHDFHEAEGRPFCIRAADSAGQRSSANVLVRKMYAWRGYEVGGDASAPSAPKGITLLASDNHSTVGTITIGFDNHEGLLVDDLFSEEVDSLRREGRKVCEFTKLAIDGVIRSRRLLASLFHVAYLFAHRINHADCLMIEVNPRHVRYYERVLGFKALGPERLNRRVNAPAVLLCLELSHARRQIALFAGMADRAVGEKSLYPYFFSPEEEAGIIARLMRR